MGWERSSDFEQEMYALVVEEASLAEVPRRVVDYVSYGEPVVHGPWEPAACSAHLLRWFDQGFIELYEVDEGEDRALSPTLGRERLLAWERWVMTTSSGLAPVFS
jgi:hypothetical protein